MVLLWGIDIDLRVKFALLLLSTRTPDGVEGKTWQ
jgi:hypothetical protein